MRFLGNIEAKMDAKGRAFLPSTFRKVLAASGEEGLVLRRDIFENCLVIYPRQIWNAEMDEMRARLSRWDRQQQMVFRKFVSGVTDLSMDGNGRILIPRTFLDAVGIGQQIRFVGMGDTIEIWPDDTAGGDEGTDDLFMSSEDFGEALQQLMGDKAGA
ncbi:MAG: division/cell wall cluster transcriptional repressor MraZ [Prevotella sp.]|jgi:MraZ protein